MLTLYRRHVLACEKRYSQNHRIFRPSTARQKNRDCRCPIQAEGTLKIEGLITNRSTKKTDWIEANLVAAQWEAWDQTTSPQADEDSIIKNPTVDYAVQSYLTSQGAQGRNVERNTYKTFDVLLTKRLLPFATDNGFSRIKTFENLDVTTKFVESWENLQPTRNRKEPVPLTVLPLAETTKKVNIERLRAFFRYCVDRKWMSENPAKKLKFSCDVVEKFGMEQEEEIALFAAMHDLPEIEAFCLAMRHGGLRISDATTLNDTELVRRASGDGWAFKIFQKKTKRWVYIPITDEVAVALHALPFKGQKDLKHYWFWSCNGERETATNNWYTKIKKIVDVVTEKNQFSHNITPHILRHTFAIRHLNAGTDIKLVSRWMGHSSTIVTNRHYSHAIHETHVASDAAYDHSIRRQRALVVEYHQDVRQGLTDNLGESIQCSLPKILPACAF